MLGGATDAAAVSAAVDGAAARGLTVDVVTGQALDDGLRARVHATGGQVALVGTPLPASPVPPPGLLPLPKFLAPRLAPLRRLQRTVQQRWRDLPIRHLTPQASGRVLPRASARLLPAPARFDQQLRRDLDARRLLGRADALLALDGEAEPVVRWWTRRRPDVTRLADPGALARWPEG